MDGPTLLRLKADSNIVAKFEIINGERRYPCDPTIAVDQMHLVFEAFSRGRELGFCLISVADPNDVLGCLVNFLHGRPLRIDPQVAQTYLELAIALGIPMVAKFAEQVLRSRSDG
jgi:hypothetical protein